MVSLARASDEWQHKNSDAASKGGFSQRLLGEQTRKDLSMTWSLGVIMFTKLPAATPTSPKEADQDAATRKGVWNKVWGSTLSHSPREVLFAQPRL